MTIIKVTTKLVKELKYAILLLVICPSLMLGAVSNVQFYADINYHDGENESETVEGTLDLFAAYKFDNTNSTLIELVLENAEDETHIEIERWWLKHKFSETISLSVGRFHTPIGFWNKNYHHGAFLFDTVDRPFYLEFEDDGGVLPSHSVGINITGKIHSYDGHFSYQLILANNQTLENSHSDEHSHAVEASPQPTSFFGDKLFLGVSLGYEPDNLPISLSLFFSDQTISGKEIELEEMPIIQLTDIFEQKIYSFDINGKWKNFDITVEYLVMVVDNLFEISESYRSEAGYLQLRYSLSSQSKLTFRSAALEFKNDNSLYHLFTQKAKLRNSLTYRHDLNINTVLKLQYSHNNYKHDLLASDNEFAVQLAFFYM